MHPLEYDQRTHKLTKLIIDYFGHRYFLNKNVLDLGCFNGDLANAFARVGARITAVDARKDHLAAINKKYPHIRTIQLDLDKDWPFADFEFDVVFSLGVMCHLKDFKKHLNQICSAAETVILETEVLDFTYEKHEIFSEDRVIHDASYNGEINLASSSAIQNTLSGIGATFRRIDNVSLGVRGHRYDWQEKNTGRNEGFRRVWFIRRDKNIAQKILNEQRMTYARQEADDRARGLETKEQQRIAREETEAKSGERKSRTGTEDQILSIPIWKKSEHISSYRLQQEESGIVINSQTNQQIKSNKSEQEKLRVLFLPLGDARGMKDAWNNINVNQTYFDYWSLWQSCKNKNTVKQQFLQKVEESKPELIHMQLQFTDCIDAETIREARKIVPNAKITNWTGDCRAHVPREFILIAPVVDYSLISSTGQLNMYRQAGCHNVRYWQIGYDPKYHFPIDKNNFDYDVSFAGNHHNNSFPDSRLRLEVVNKCKSLFNNRFGIFGSGYPGSKPIDIFRINEMYNKSVCTLSISHFNNIAHYFSDRLLHCVASGRPTITWYFPGIEDYFTEGKDILVARSDQDVINHVNFCKNDLEQAKNIGIEGYKKVLKDHTYTARAIELLKITNLLDRI